MDDSKVAVLLEDLISKFHVFDEGLDSLHDDMNQRFTALEEKFDNISSPTVNTPADYTDG